MNFTKYFQNIYYYYYFGGEMGIRTPDTVFSLPILSTHCQNGWNFNTYLARRFQQLPLLFKGYWRTFGELFIKGYQIIKIAALDCVLDY